MLTIRAQQWLTDARAVSYTGCAMKCINSSICTDFYQKLTDFWLGFYLLSKSGSKHLTEK